MPFCEILILNQFNLDLCVMSEKNGFAEIEAWEVCKKKQRH